MVLEQKDDCYNNLPVQDGLFMDPVTRLLSTTAAVTACIDRFPLVVLADNGKYVAIKPQITLIPAPATEAPWEMSIKDLTTGTATAGLYTNYEMNSYNLLTEFPSYRKAVLTGISMSACRNADCMPAMTDQITYPRYELNPLNEAEEKIHVLTHPAEVITQWANQYAKYCAVGVAIYITTKLTLELMAIICVAFLGGLPAALHLAVEFYGKHWMYIQQTLKMKYSMNSDSTYIKVADDDIVYSKLLEEQKKNSARYPPTAILQ